MVDMKFLWCNKNFILLLISYGMNTGCYYAISTLLNPIVLGYFGPSQALNAGRMGLTIVVSGFFGSLAGGAILDKSKAFKFVTVTVYLASLLSILLFTLLLYLGPGPIWASFITAFLLGFFMTGYLPVGFEFGVEITFPVGEGTSAGLLNASSQLFGTLLTIVMESIQSYSSAVKSEGLFYGNVAITAVLFVGFVMNGFIKSDLRRFRSSGKKG